MKLYYPEEHTSCCRYVDMKREESPVTSYQFDSGHIRREVTKVTELVFMLEGHCLLSYDGIIDMPFKTGQTVLLPVGSSYRANMVEQSRILACRIPPDIRLCDSFSLQQLIPMKQHIQKGLPVLPINERVRACLDNLAECIDDGLRCEEFLKLKVREIMYLFRAYYSREELTAFFHPILNNDLYFASLMLKNWRKAKNKTELAMISNLSPSRFGVKFKEVFGISPYQWLIGKKCDAIRYELTSTNKSIKQISEELNFNSVQHFNDFCKKQLGKAPGQIRDYPPKKKD